MSGGRRVVALLLAGTLALAAASRAGALEPESVPPAEAVPAAGGELESIRTALVELRFEEAVEEATRVLERADLSEEVRLGALILRSEAHVALGQWEALERDYAAILAARPAFVPDPAIAPRKARERFDRVRAAAIGSVRLDVRPADAVVTVGGRPVERDAEGLVPLPAGPQTLEVARPGFDPASHSLVVDPAKTTDAVVTLTPNARSVLMLTEPDGVEVALDGRVVGTTSRAAPGEPATLLLELLPLGGHAFTLSKACHRTEQRQELVAADLSDNSPWKLGPVELRPVRAKLALAGEPAGAAVSLDGREAGELPLELEACPGRHELLVRQGDRRVWTGEVELAGETTTSVAVAPRPNVVLAGSHGWPPWLERYEAAFNVVARDAPLPADPTAAAGWGAAPLPADADLVLAAIASPGGGEAVRWLAYSPWLGQPAPLDPASGGTLARPPTETGAWGLRTADSALGGPALVVEVTAQGAAAAIGISPGDRITALGGAPVTRAEQVRRILRAASPARPLAVVWATPGDPRREGALAAVTSPLIEPSAGSVMTDANRAAWASADAALEGPRGQRARAVLALLAESWGRPDLAVETWRRVDLPERRGVGRGMASYCLGRALERSGMAGEAAEAYRAAARSEGTLFHDEGPPVAPAARDRLAELSR